MPIKAFAAIARFVTCEWEECLDSLAVVTNSENVPVDIVALPSAVKTARGKETVRCTRVLTSRAQMTEKTK